LIRSMSLTLMRVSLMNRYPVTELNDVIVCNHSSA
jgi:hypothetical protein